MSIDLGQQIIAALDAALAHIPYTAGTSAVHSQIIAAMWATRAELDRNNDLDHGIGHDVTK